MAASFGLRSCHEVLFGVERVPASERARHVKADRGAQGDEATGHAQRRRGIPVSP
jgi:hypothetical protein